MGKFSQCAHGEWAGIKEGIISGQDFYDIASAFNDQKFLSEYPFVSTEEYLIGFGIGLPKGRVIRDRLYNNLQGSNIQEKADLLGKFMDNYGMWKWTKCFEDIEVFLKHQHQWDLLDIPVEVSQNSLNLINENLFQRAIENLTNFYFQNYHLKAWIITYNFLNELNQIRWAKMRHKLTDEESQRRRRNLKLDIINWIKCNAISYS